MPFPSPRPSHVRRACAALLLCLPLLSLRAAEPDFARLRQQLLDRGLREEVAADRGEVAEIEAGRQRIERCGTPQAAPACQVQVRYLYQILRGNPPEQVGKAGPIPKESGIHTQLSGGISRKDFGK